MDVCICICSCLTKQFTQLSHTGGYVVCGDYCLNCVCVCVKFMSVLLESKPCISRGSFSYILLSSPCVTFIISAYTPWRVCLHTRIYIYIWQFSSFRASMLWFIDLTVASCHIQYTFLSLCQFFFFFHKKMDKTREYLKSTSLF